MNILEKKLAINYLNETNSQILFEVAKWLAPAVLGRTEEWKRVYDRGFENLPLAMDEARNRKMEIYFHEGYGYEHTTRTEFRDGVVLFEADTPDFEPTLERALPQVIWGMSTIEGNEDEVNRVVSERAGRMMSVLGDKMKKDFQAVATDDVDNDWQIRAKVDRHWRRGNDKGLYTVSVEVVAKRDNAIEAREEEQAEARTKVLIKNLCGRDNLDRKLHDLPNRSMLDAKVSLGDIYGSMEKVIEMMDEDEGWERMDEEEKKEAGFSENTPAYKDGRGTLPGVLVLTTEGSKTKAWVHYSKEHIKESQDLFVGKTGELARTKAREQLSHLDSMQYGTKVVIDMRQMVEEVARQAFQGVENWYSKAERRFVAESLLFPIIAKEIKTGAPIKVRQICDDLVGTMINGGEVETTPRTVTTHKGVDRQDWCLDGTQGIKLTISKSYN